MFSCRGFLIAAAVVLLAPLGARAQDSWQPLVYDPQAAPLDNPLRGFFPFQGAGGDAGFPHSMEFRYLAMNDLVVGADVLDFTALEALLDDVKSRGNQTIFRIYLDHPDCCPDGEYHTGVPDYLLAGDDPLTLTPYAEHDGGMSPDYDDERLVSAIEGLIAELGSRYDGDVRIAFIELGILGMWGEWHTYPFDGDERPSNFMASSATQNRVLASFDAAFAETKLLVSQDVLQYVDPDGGDGGTVVAGRDVGFHDDNFAVATYDADPDRNMDYFFWPRLREHGLLELWRSVPVGGEVQPAIQSDVFRPGWEGQDYGAAVDATHASWLLNQFAFEDDGDAQRGANTLEASRRLGYRLTVTEVRLSDTTPEGPLVVGVRIENRGVAPFYYDWPVELAALDDGGAPVHAWMPRWSLSEVMPGAGATELESSEAAHGLAAGRYTIAMRVPNPMPGGKPLKFANAEQESTWLLLGVVNVSDSEPSVVYAPSEEPVPNPERGFYHHTQTHDPNAGETIAADYRALDPATLTTYRETEGVTLISRIFYLDDFVDSDHLSPEYVARVEADLDAVRVSGLKAVVRFAYTNRTVGWPPQPPYGDSAFALNHIEDLRQTLEDNADVIAVLQAGFIGIWGEWFYTDHFVDDPASPATVLPADIEARDAVLAALLDVLPQDRMVQLRAPRYMQWHNGSEAVEAVEAHSGSARARTGLHNDCFLASEIDFGTYLAATRTEEQTYLEEATHYVPMGGETCNDTTDDKEPTMRSRCPTALAELARFHWSFLNILYHPDVIADWRLSGCFDEIERRLGFRFVLVEGSYAQEVRPGGSFDVRIALRNDGWAAPFNPRLVELLLRHVESGRLYGVTLPDDPRLWLADSLETYRIEHTICTPETMPLGSYELLLNLPDPEPSLRTRSEYAVRLANADVWEETTGYNRLLHQLAVTLAAPASGCDTPLELTPRDNEPDDRRFQRADTNSDGDVNLADAIFVLAYLFTGGSAPQCLDTADADDDSNINVTDPVSILGFLFLGTRAPETPFPDCGLDETADSFGCNAFPPCGTRS